MTKPLLLTVCALLIAFGIFTIAGFGWLFRAIARCHRHGPGWLGSLPGSVAYLILIRRSGGLNEKGDF